MARSAVAIFISAAGCGGRGPRRITRLMAFRPGWSAPAPSPREETKRCCVLASMSVARSPTCSPGMPRPPRIAASARPRCSRPRPTRRSGCSPCSRPPGSTRRRSARSSMARRSPPTRSSSAATPSPRSSPRRGFRDVLEIGRQRRRHLYDPYQVKVPPLIERSRRFTVAERMGADRRDGRAARPRRRAPRRRAHRRAGISSIAVAFINAYANGEHEEEMRDILLETIPDARDRAVSQTRPKMRELGRFVTTAIRAALLPTVGDYIGRLGASSPRRAARRRCSSSRATAA